MVQLKCQNRAAEIIIHPTSSALIIKELGNYERDRKKVKNVTHKGNLTLEQVKKIAKVIEEKSMAKNFTGTVKQVLGTCLSIGCTVDKQSPKDVIAKLTRGELKVWFEILFKLFIIFIIFQSQSISTCFIYIFDLKLIGIFNFLHCQGNNLCLNCPICQINRSKNCHSTISSSFSLCSKCLSIFIIFYISFSK